MTSPNRKYRSLSYPDGTTLVRDERERGTRVFFGREYHWARNPEGRLSLRRGHDPLDIRSVADLLPQTAAAIGDLP